MPRRMAQYGLQISQVHIVDGFADDCDELLHRCLKVGTLTFDTFAEIWKDMKFAKLYKNRGTHAEVAEMSEEFLHIAKRYMVANTSNYEESVMGLFLVYALLNLQPYAGFAPVRIIPDDVPAIARIEMVARRDRRLDVLRILGSVLIEGPCHYSIVDRVRGLESGFRKYYKGFSTLDLHGVRPKGVFYRQNTELDLIRDLINVSKGYTEAKASLTDQNRTDSYTDPKLPQELESSLKTVINGVFAVADKDDGAEEGSSERCDKVHLIKMKAMKGTVNKMNHLTGLADRKKQKKNREKKSVEIKKQGGRIKSSSPTKPLQSSSPKKRKASSSPRKKRCKKRKYIESDSDEELSDLPSSDDDIDLPSDSDIDDINDESENIMLEAKSAIQFHKNIVENSDIGSGTGENVEIEIVDTCSIENNEIRNRNVNKPVPTEESIALQTTNSDQQIVTINEGDIVNRIKKVSHRSITKEKETMVESAVTRSKDESQKKDDDVFKKPEAIDIKKLMPKLTVEKRDQKRITIKSKFKKMGLLSVTNIKEK